ncbi:hypothetical protein LTS18_008903 [Coniosporium uncinatum]|uniref:Uncharacterized protein n=1 Tax=Coniosporium uncinatum TaxID=93489 RepID=A0ACC3DXB0_9PEZI|nr:hypothetical protein LTS18_008903 [Coniosporium uncinatum]
MHFFVTVALMALSAFAAAEGVSGSVPFDPLDMSNDPAAGKDIEAVSIKGAIIAAEHPAHLIKRGQPGGVYVCQNRGWVGPCQWIYIPGKCVNLTSKWYRNMSAVGPDRGTQCWIYYDYWCKRPFYAFSHPGEGDLSSLPGGHNIDNQAYSIWCKINGH